MLRAQRMISEPPSPAEKANTQVKTGLPCASAAHVATTATLVRTNNSDKCRSKGRARLDACRGPEDGSPQGQSATPRGYGAWIGVGTQQANSRAGATFRHKLCGLVARKKAPTEWSGQVANTALGRSQPSRSARLLIVKAACPRLYAGGQTVVVIDICWRAVLRRSPANRALAGGASAGALCQAMQTTPERKVPDIRSKEMASRVTRAR
jgi:hypothetical protein